MWAAEARADEEWAQDRYYNEDYDEYTDEELGFDDEEDEDDDE